MNKIFVSKISNIVFIGEIQQKNTNSKGKWKLNYCCSELNKKMENGRVYFITSDEEIKKIGCSSCKGGIKTTFSSYEGGLGGKPSIRTFGIHKLIQKEIDKGKSVKIYCLFNDWFETMIQGITSKEKKKVFPDIKEMERMCTSDYKKIFGKYPPWSFQENGEEWPKEIKISYNLHLQLKNKKPILNKTKINKDRKNRKNFIYEEDEEDTASEL